ncbi:hypothetical protein ACLOJK_012633, partial [Asimina triloba]
PPEHETLCPLLTFSGMTQDWIFVVWCVPLPCQCRGDEKCDLVRLVGQPNSIEGYVLACKEGDAIRPTFLPCPQLEGTPMCVSWIAAPAGIVLSHCLQLASPARLPAVRRPLACHSPAAHRPPASPAAAVGDKGEGDAAVRLLLPIVNRRTACCGSTKMSLGASLMPGSASLGSVTKIPERRCYRRDLLLLPIGGEDAADARVAVVLVGVRVRRIGGRLVVAVVLAWFDRSIAAAVEDDRTAAMAAVVCEDGGTPYSGAPTVHRARCTCTSEITF